MAFGSNWRRWGWMVLILVAGMTRGLAATYVVEAEGISEGTWTAKELEGASGGKILFGSARLREGSGQTTLVVPAAGRYRVWVRYHLSKPTSPGFYVLMRDEAGREAAFHFCDWSAVMPSDRPYEEPTMWAGERTGWLWEGFDAVFERPMAATLEFGIYATGASRQRKGIADREVDCLLLTTDDKLDPSGLDAAALEKLAVIPALTEPAPPAGMVWSAGLPLTVTGFAGAADHHGQFEAGLVNNGSYFVDSARQVYLGFNRDHGTPSAESARHGVLTHRAIESYHGNARALDKEHPSPEGRFVNAQGQVSKTFSFHFQPAIESAQQGLEERLKAALEHPYADSFEAWRTSVEDGGYLDYSEVSQAAFRAWLKAKHGTIETLNQRWGATYTSFDEIKPPASYAEGRAGWLEFRYFCGQTYAEAVARQLPVIARLDPKKRPCIGANSSLDLLAPYFSALRPIDYDEFLNSAYKSQPRVSWDTYCADDQIACETSMMASFAEGRKVVIQEWSNHVVDSRLAARSYWEMVSKGVAGIYLFMFQEGTFHATYPKWALLSQDRTPKPKLAAYSDAVQEVHRLEPLLMEGASTFAVKPVAMYWSRIDLSIAPPYGSLYGCTLNSPVHTYATLRSAGYPVRWITPRQVLAGDLEKVGAVVLVGVNHVPQAVAGKLEAWVKDGGVVVGDELPGAWDEYAQPQATLAPVFGIRAAAPKGAAKTGTLAVQESTQGYGEVTDAAVERKEPYTRVDEIAQQPSATHPVAKAMGDYMVSGIATQPVDCVSGWVVGMTHRGRPGFIVNDYGKGKAFYSTLMLGTIYESGPTPYEWDSAHMGTAFPRLLDAFLQGAGVKRDCDVEGLAPLVRAKVRVEPPIVDKSGNAVIGLVSFNDDWVKPFQLKVALPEGARGPFAGVFLATQGSRELQQVEATVADGQLSLPVATFDTHAVVIAVKEARPLLGLDVGVKTRGTAHLGVVAPGETLPVKVTVYNVTGKALPAGEVTLLLPKSWSQSAVSVPVPPLAAGKSAAVEFQAQAPALAATGRLVPVLTRYKAGGVESTPATEMVWWGMGQ